MFIYCYVDHTTQSDTATYNYYSTQQYYVQETPLGTLTPKPKERIHLSIYNIIITMAVIVTVCFCISTVLIAACVKKSILAWRKVKTKVSTSSNKVNHEHYKISEPVYATISETSDLTGEMQVEMTNNVAYKAVDFTKTTITSMDVDFTRNEAYAVTCHITEQ